jgi:hypothetical protein
MHITSLIHSVPPDIIYSGYISILSYHLHPGPCKPSPTFYKFCPNTYCNYYPNIFGGDILWTSPVRILPQTFFTSSFSGFWLPDTLSKPLKLTAKAWNCRNNRQIVIVLLETLQLVSVKFHNPKCIAHRFAALASATVGSNSAGGMVVRLLCLLCCVGSNLLDRPIPRPEDSYRVWCVFVWSRNLTNEVT